MKGTQVLLGFGRSVCSPRVPNFQVRHPAIAPQGFLGAANMAGNKTPEETFSLWKFQQSFPRSSDGAYGSQVMEKAVLALKLL